MYRNLLTLVMMFLFLAPFSGCSPPAAGPAPSKTQARPVVPDPKIRSSAAIVADLETGQVFYSRDADEPRAVASLSKLMAALVLLEAGLDMDGSQTISRADHRLVRRGAPSRLQSGSSYSHRDLLHAALMVSDNVAIVALGRSMGWSSEEFARRMTLRAAALGLIHTRFGDPTGLDEGNLSTAREMLVILKLVLAHPVLQPICQTQDYVVMPVRGRGRPILYRHTDSFIRRHPWEILGAKTGYTAPAQYCLAIGARLEEHTIGLVFLGAIGELTRFGDYSRAMRWLAQHTGQIASKGQP